MKYPDFIMTGIKLDSIVVPKPRYPDELDSLMFVGSSVFMYDYVNKRCDAKVVQFDKINFVQLGKFLVNKETTFNDLRKMFPTNCSTTKPTKHYMSNGTFFDACSINVRGSDGRIWDMKIYFYLRDNKLFGIEFWEPS